MATLKDVAEKAGVSIATASNVLTGAKRVKPDLKQRVEQAIADLNYTPQRCSRKNADKITYTRNIGFVASQIDCIFLPIVILGIQKVLAENGYNMILYSTNFQSDIEKEYINNLVNSNVDGIIVDSVVSVSDTAYFDHLAHLSYNGKKIPVVSLQLDLTPLNISSIVLNSFSGGYMAAKHLIQKGCKKIACITGPLAASWNVDRLEGYKQCLADYQIPFNSSYVAMGDCTTVSGYLQTNSLLLNAVDFDGLFVQNDLMTVGAIKALQERSIKIPEQVKLVGYDNIFVATITSPSITSIHIPKRRLGEEAASCLLNQIRSASDTPSVERIELPLTLTERQTTNKEIADNWDLNLF